MKSWIIGILTAVGTTLVLSLFGVIPDLFWWIHDEHNKKVLLPRVEYSETEKARCRERVNWFRVQKRLASNQDEKDYIQAIIDDTAGGCK